MAVPRSTKDLEGKGAMNARKGAIKKGEEDSGKMMMIDPYLFHDRRAVNIKQLRKE